LLVQGSDQTPSKLCNGGTGGGVAQGSVMVNQRIHSITQKYFSNTRDLVNAHYYWEQADDKITPDIRGKQNSLCPNNTRQEFCILMNYLIYIYFTYISLMSITYLLMKYSNLLFYFSYIIFYMSSLHFK